MPTKIFIATLPPQDQNLRINTPRQIKSKQVRQSITQRGGAFANNYCREKNKYCVFL
jgi:hypothetical protein